ncbi:MAG TPA: c-type cytochrome domain-containing protein [Candidatus Sulfotelmatobacter sp.]|nr:c-type cytochrome domain-containing protein [Candidatus Sulfotelmatobacter sp.]
MIRFATLWPDRLQGYIRSVPGRVQGIAGQFRPGILTLALILTALIVSLVFPPDGNERAEWAQFIGRFHPLVVHFPIAFLSLAPILELAGRSVRFSYLRLSSGFVLGLATLSATLAAWLGWCLARSGGYSGPLLKQHMWGGIALAALCWLCWLMRTHAGGRESGPGLPYGLALAIGVGVVAWTGYRGGQVSLGQDHLTEHMPPGLRHALGMPDSALALLPGSGATTFYGKRVQPIFAERCVSCHGPEKQKGNLRLDNYRGLMRGGKDGPVIRPGNAQGSDLLRRISLPPGHDDFMPKAGKRPLSSDQVKLIELWIGAGASGTLPVDAIKDAPTDSSPSTAVVEVKFAEIDAAAVTKLRAGIAPVVARLQKRFPNILDYESRGSANLHVNAAILGQKFEDSDLEALAPVAEHITLADFSRTRITDRSVKVIAAMKQLRVLRLTHTAITDQMLEGLGALDQLESLNVFDTRVTAASLPTIGKLPRLAHCYVGQTAIPSGIVVPKTLQGKIVF